ncbi:GNAT family N-acetyltransferase, partial [Candidatus Micrarchaeota archaeon]|nr:GNAT family N-acetyltransferase [Candidatus Micrarchaeota archaeon]
MINIRSVSCSEFERVKPFISNLFPSAIVQLCDDDLIFVAEENGKVVGFLHMIEYEESFVLEGIGVKESSRNSGVGSLLMSHVCELAEGSGKPVHLKVKCMNP